MVTVGSSCNDGSSYNDESSFNDGSSKAKMSKLRNKKKKRTKAAKNNDFVAKKKMGVVSWLEAAESVLSIINFTVKMGRERVAIVVSKSL